MYKGVNNGVFLFNNLSSVTFKWLSRMLAVKLAQVSPFLDYICSHLLRGEVGIRARLANTRQHTVFFLSITRQC
jgi:hypothetical protein